MVKLSIIVVTFNHQSEIKHCLNSLSAALPEISTQILIIDNNSSDETVPIAKSLLQKLRPQFQWSILQNKTNLGFTKAVNQGLRRCVGEWVLLLNPDTQLRANVLDVLIQKLKDNPELGIVAPQLRNPDGRLQPSCRRFPRHRDLIFEAIGLSRLFPMSRIFNYWKMGDFDHQSQRFVDQPQGAFLLTQRSAIEKVGLLDEQFPMFFSDVDWCRRFAQHKLKILFLPSVHIFHDKGTSIYRNRLKMFWTSHRSFYDYFRKYYPGPWWKIFNYATGQLLILIALLRALFYMIAHDQSGECR